MIKFTKKRKLDMLVWTHPHDDHSIGLEHIISKRCDKNTKIVTAEILNSKLPKYTNVCDSIISYISTKNTYKKFNNRWSINPVGHFPEVLQEIVFTKGKDIIEKMVIRCISPYPNIGNVQAGLDNENINKLSVGIIIEINRIENRLNFLFSGDMEKQTIEAIMQEQEDEEIPSIYNYIKIPHHGSEKSSNLVDILDSELKSEIGCSTVFCKKELPRMDAIRKYSNFIESLYCTSNINTKNYGNGVIEVNYDVKNKKSFINFSGTASKIVI